ncbi:hypothetical protein JW921_04025 [Candidatus Fermentibacterales bacterium]|nr:hypothetical protein [Candidatus Fermentibacterales bacterium]
MMKKNVFVVLCAIVASALILLACGEDSTGPSGPQGDDWMPLAIGNHWQSVIEGYLTAAGDTTDVDGTIDRQVMGIVSHDQGFDVWEFRTISSMTFYPPQGGSYSLSETTLVYLYADSLEVRIYEDTLTADFELVLDLPLEVGNTWYSYPDSSWISEVISLTASVTVPAGSFTGCAHIEGSDPAQPGDTYNSYLCRGVGIVKEVVDEDDVLADSHVEMELESYDLN